MLLLFFQQIGKHIAALPKSTNDERSIRCFFCASNYANKLLEAAGPEDEEQDQDKDSNSDAEFEIQESSALIADQEIEELRPTTATSWKAARDYCSTNNSERSVDREAVEIQVRPHTATRTTDQEKAPEAKAHGKRRLLSTGKCPVCGEQKKHLCAHLATRKPGHGWSAEI